MYVLYISTSDDEEVCYNERTENELHFRPLLIARKELSQESTAFSIPLSIFILLHSLYIVYSIVLLRNIRLGIILSDEDGNMDFVATK